MNPYKAIALDADEVLALAQTLVKAYDHYEYMRDNADSLAEMERFADLAKGIADQFAVIGGIP